MTVALFIGCSSVRHTPKGEPIYFSGTREYQRKIETLALTAEQARERVAEYVSARRPDSPYKLLIGQHQVIVGDSFVFAMKDKMDVVLSGYYVDGHTGTVTERQEGRTRYPKKT
jgi:uncharacterized protein YfaT (DUF1175 family)